MTEAFEIGVSLALQDGVSDAIGKARRDVAALEHAVRESGVSLRALREVGVRSASVAFGERRKDAAEAPAKRLVQEVAPRAETEGPPRLEAREAPPRAAAVPAIEVIAPSRLAAEVAPRAEPDETPRIETDASPRRVEDAGAWSAPVALQQAAQSRAGDWPEAMGLTPRLDAPADQPAAQAPVVMPANVPVQRFVDAPPAAVPSEGMRRVSAPLDVGAEEDTRLAAPSVSASMGTQAAAPLIVPQAQPQVQLGTVQEAAQAVAPAMVVAEAARGAPLPREPFAVARNSEKERAGQMTLLSALRLSGGFTVATQNDDHSDGSAGDDVVAAFQDTAMQAAPLEAAPAVMSQGRAPVAGVAGPAAKAKTVDQAEGQDAGPQGGDVFLDGMLVGRWMSRFLNREAERASAGPTGFDPRRSRLLPGVTVGG